MNDYNFWADLLDTFQSSPDWIKALWLLIPPCFLLALIRILVRYRLASMQLKAKLIDELVFPIDRRPDGHLQIIRHRPETIRDSAMLLLDESSASFRDHQNLETKPPTTRSPAGHKQLESSHRGRHSYPDRHHPSARRRVSSGRAWPAFLAEYSPDAVRLCSRHYPRDLGDPAEVISALIGDGTSATF